MCTRSGAPDHTSEIGPAWFRTFKKLRAAVEDRNFVESASTYTGIRSLRALQTAAEVPTLLRKADSVTASAPTTTMAAFPSESSQAGSVRRVTRRPARESSRAARRPSKFGRPSAQKTPLILLLARTTAPIAVPL